MKKCKACEQMLPLEMFNKQIRGKDGLSLYCEQCEAERRRAYRASRGPYPSDSEERTRRPGYYSDFRQEYEGKYPERKRARDAVARAIGRGEIPPIDTRQCVECNSKAKDYHHSDYSKPLEVVPLCRSCHRKWHHKNTI